MVLVAFMVGFVVFGTMYSFGAFFVPMTQEFQASRAAMSAFFSLTGLIFYLTGSLAGHLGDRFGPAVMAGLGAMVMGSGLGLSGFIGQMWQGYLTYGIGVGLGAACAYTPTLAILGGWFARQRNAALGIAAAGTGCGMLVLPPLCAAWIGQYGWRTTSMIVGGISAVLLALAAALVRPPPVAAASAARSLGGVLRSFEFRMLYASWVLATVALFVPMVFLPAYVSAHFPGVEPIFGIGLDDRTAGPALLSLLGGVSILGRLGMGPLGGKIGTARLFKASVLLMAASYLLWLLASSYVWLMVFAMALGLGYGLRISLMPAVLIDLFGVRNLGAILGAFYTASGVSAVLGPLLAGVVIDATQNDQAGILFALAAGTLGFAAVAFLRIMPSEQGTESDR